MAVELEALDRLSDPALGSFSRDQLRALAVKVIRIHLMGAADRRRSEDWNADDARALARMLSAWTEIGGGKDAVYRASGRRSCRRFETLIRHGLSVPRMRVLRRRRGTRC